MAAESRCVVPAVPVLRLPGERGHWCGARLPASASVHISTPVPLPSRRSSRRLPLPFPSACPWRCALGPARRSRHFSEGFPYAAVLCSRSQLARLDTGSSGRRGCPQSPRRSLRMLSPSPRPPSTHPRCSRGRTRAVRSHASRAGGCRGGVGPPPPDLSGSWRNRPCPPGVRPALNVDLGQTVSPRANSGTSQRLRGSYLFTQFCYPGVFPTRRFCGFAGIFLPLHL